MRKSSSKKERTKGIIMEPWCKVVAIPRKKADDLGLADKAQIEEI